ncbi:MAG: DMT family transporter [Desulfomonilia bacterium]|nr:DMT family transporter [Deltaproteobacteria bacterium]MDX9762650.1 DMT family transporter [Desulfomonilia bacterium]
MDWLFLAVLAAFSLATADALTKKHFSRLSAYEMGITRLTYTLPWLVIALFFIPWPCLDRTFFLAFGAALPLEVLAFLCYMRAIKISPLSLTLPFLAFTPVFIILTGRLILGETVTGLGIAGILCIVAGAYSLNLSQARTGVLEPFRAIFREPGSVLMLLVSFIYSITSTLGKLAVLHSNPYFFGVSYYMVLALLMLSFLPLAKNARAENLLKNPRAGLMVGTFMAIMVISHMLAISLVEAAYMIAVKRTSLLFGVLYGAWLFREAKITERLAGALIMMVGVLIIGWYG